MIVVNSSRSAWYRSTYVTEGPSVEDTRSIAMASHLLQEFHVLATHSSLTELQHSMGGGGIVQDDLENLGAEEVGQGLSPLIHTAVLLWGREGGGRCIVVTRDFVAVGGRVGALRNLHPLTAGRSRVPIRSSMTCTKGHFPCYQRHVQQ